jgi:hypothetical protein
MALGQPARPAIPAFHRCHPENSWPVSGGCQEALHEAGGDTALTPGGTIGEVVDEAARRWGAAAAPVVPGAAPTCLRTFCREPLAVYQTPGCGGPSRTFPDRLRKIQKLLLR